MIETLIREKREQILAIAERHGAVNVRLFGSVAHGNARPDSDVDLLVDVRGPVDSLFPAGLISDLEDLLGHRVDVVPEYLLVSQLRPAVVASAIPLDSPLPRIHPADPAVAFKDDRLYLDHILESIERVGLATTGGRDAFLSQLLVNAAALRFLQTMAESTRRLSDQAKEMHPEVNWKRLSDFRNVLVHGYLSLDLELVWMHIEQDLPTLKEAALTLRKSMM